MRLPGMWTMSAPWPSRYLLASREVPISFLPIRDLETEAVGWLLAPT
jgi:hypothetical protein